jgi:TonB-dependent receptor
MKSRNSFGISMRALLMGGACLGALSWQAAQAQQANNDDKLDEVVVSGIRGALQRDLDIKRDAEGLVDAISATDIGKFPDSDIAAAMQRIPGVSISRGTANSGGVPTSTGDAAEITVRGFGPSFNETLFDGRQISTATGSRAFDFSSVSADFVKEVDIKKSPDASLSSGAIGATVNIMFPKPFDHPGLQMSASGSESYSDSAGVAPTPQGTFLISDTFAHNTIGILADVSYSDHRTQGNHVNSQGWEGTTLNASQLAPGQNAANLKSWFIQDYGIYQEQDQERRLNGRLALQWAPSDKIVVTVDDNYSRDQLTQTQYGYSVWFNGGSLANVTRDSNGTVTNFQQTNSPTDFQSQINGKVVENNNTGINLKWDVLPKLQIEADADHAQSWLNPGGQLTSLDMDVGYGPSATGGTNGATIGVMTNGSTGLPVVTGYGPNSNASLFINNGLIGSHVFPESSQQNFDTVNQMKLEGTWTEDKIRIKAGVQYNTDHESLREYDSFANNDWQAYSGYGPASNNPGGVALPQSWFTGSFSTSNFINGFSGALPPNVLKFNALQVVNYLQSLGNPQTNKNIAGFNYGGVPAYNGMYAMIENAGSHQDVVEDTLAAYLTANAQTEIGGRPLQINLGLREEDTRLKSYGIGQLPTSLAVQSSDHTAFIVGYGPQSIVETGNNYMYLLPNLDLNFSAFDDLAIRFDASRTLTRPELSYLSPVLNVGQGQRVGALVATGGNPQLNPYTSDNVDLSAEWYYLPNSYFSVDGFVKNVSNFIVGGANKQSINGVVDPTTGTAGQFTVSTNVNGPTAKVYGAEFAVQHVFWDTGWGLQANATIVGTNKPYDPSNTSITGFAVTGLADSANLVGFYDKYGFQARVALNWRAEYLDHFGQQQNNSAFGAEPTFVNSTTQVDFSSSYDFTKQFSVYFEALNLNDATYSTHGRYSDQILDVIDYGRRFTLGFHAKL